MNEQGVIILNLLDQYIIDEFYGGGSSQLSAGHFNKVIKLNPAVLEYLENRYSDSESVKETLYRIKNSIETHPICPVCGTIIKFKRIFTECCCVKCAAKYSVQKRKETNIVKYGTEYYVLSSDFKNRSLEKYGVDNPAKASEVKEKSRLTCTTKYGCDTYSKTDEYKELVKQTCLEKYGVTNPMKNELVIEKRKNDSLEKYGVDNPCKNPIIKQKIKESVKQYWLINFGIENVWLLPTIKDKILQTCLEKYGVISPILNKEIKDKIINTDIEKYGAPWYLGSILNILKNHSPEAMQKRYETHKKNNSFNTSKIELKFKDYLEANYKDDYEYLYKSDLYPFNCDFYIKSLNLYIEINASWTHGGHPFNENSDEDQLQLNKWKLKNTKYYDNAINTWTVGDVKKRLISKQNNLNYLEIFSNDINECIDIFHKHITLHKQDNFK